MEDSVVDFIACYGKLVQDEMSVDINNTMTHISVMRAAYSK